MAITFSNLGASAAPDFANTSGGTSFNTASWTPPTSGLIILFVVNNQFEGFNDAPSVSGNGLTWQQKTTRTFKPIDEFFDETRITMYVANASGATTGQTTISFLDSQDWCSAVFFHATGVDLSGGALNAIVQTRTGAGAGTSGAPSVMASASNANNRPIAAFAHLANNATTPRANWTEFDDLASTFVGLESQARSDAFETNASASWGSSVFWGAISAEVKAASSTPIAVFVHHYRQQGMM